MGEAAFPGSGSLRKLRLKRPLGLPSAEGLTGARRSVSRVTGSLGWQVSAGVGRRPRFLSHRPDDSEGLRAQRVGLQGLFRCSFGNHTSSCAQGPLGGR